MCFQAIWNRQHIKGVQVIFKEDFGVEGRAGYFDQYGMIRDVMQNHLLQVMALIAMEQPLSFEAEHIRAEKLKVRSSRDLAALSPRSAEVPDAAPTSAGGRVLRAAGHVGPRL